MFKHIRDRIEIFEQTYSRFRSDSLVTKISQLAGEYSLPADAQPLFSLYHRLYQITDGAFTPLIGQALVAAGYDPAYSLQSKTIEKIPTWKETMHYDFPKLLVRKPILLDFGAAGKGYLVDIVSKHLQDTGITDFCIDAGGDIYYSNEQEQSLSVGLEHPQDAAQVIGIAHILNQSICGSSGNRRQWGNFHHIIDSHTLQSPQHIAAIWVVAKETFIADALTTCLFFVPAEVLAKSFSFEYLIMYTDSTIAKSTHFPAELFIQES